MPVEEPGGHDHTATGKPQGQPSLQPPQQHCEIRDKQREQQELTGNIRACSNGALLNKLIPVVMSPPGGATRPYRDIISVRLHHLNSILILAR